MTKSGKTFWKKEKLLVLSNLLFCHNVFKKPSAAEASESVYMKERVNLESLFCSISFTAFKMRQWCTPAG